jgi:dienelactone hydrolase
MRVMRGQATRIVAVHGALLVAACGGSSGSHGVAIDSATGGGDTPAAQIDSAAGGEGGSASGTDPADTGPYATTHADASIPGSAGGRTVPATIYTPMGANGPRPFVVVSPGFQMARTQYASYAEHLASWGFVVALCDYADQGFFADHQKLADDVSSVIDWALAHEPIDASKLATAGHSLGGDISVLAAADDTRIAAVVGWDPVDASNPSVVPEKMTGFHAALAVAGETTDASGGGMPCAPSADNFQAFYAAAPAPAIQLTLAGADHMDWVDDGSCAFCGLCTAGTADPALAHATTRRLTVAWLRRTFEGDTAMDAWLDTPPEAGTAVTRK